MSVPNRAPQSHIGSPFPSVPYRLPMVKPVSALYRPHAGLFGWFLESVQTYFEYKYLKI